MPQGLCNAPMTAQRLIDRIMRGAHRHACGLMDDLVVYSTSWDNHLSHVRDVLQRLRNAGLTVNVKKCAFTSDSIKIFGFWIKQGRICVDDEKLETAEK